MLKPDRSLTRMPGDLRLNSSQLGSGYFHGLTGGPAHTSNSTSSAGLAPPFQLSRKQPVLPFEVPSGCSSRGGGLWSRQQPYSSIATQQSRKFVLPGAQSVFDTCKAWRGSEPVRGGAGCGGLSPSGLLGAPPSPLQRRVQQRNDMFNTLSGKYTSASVSRNAGFPLREMLADNLSRSFEHPPPAGRAKCPARDKSLPGRGRGPGKENDDPHIAIFGTSSSSEGDEEEEDDELFRAA